MFATFTNLSVLTLAAASIFAIAALASSEFASYILPSILTFLASKMGLVGSPGLACVLNVAAFCAAIAAC